MIGILLWWLCSLRTWSRTGGGAGGSGRTVLRDILSVNASEADGQSLQNTCVVPVQTELEEGEGE